MLSAAFEGEIQRGRGRLIGDVGPCHAPSITGESYVSGTRKTMVSEHDLYGQVARYRSGRMQIAVTHPSEEHLNFST